MGGELMAVVKASTSDIDLLARLIRAEAEGEVFINLLGKNAKIFIIPFKINGAGNYRAPFILLSEIYSNHYN
jgi:hypothetical protein